MDIAGLIEKGMSFLLGVLVTGIVVHFLSKDRDRQTHKAIAFHEAATNFRHSFDDILLNIEKWDHPAHELLRNFFLSHKVAMWHFKYYLTGKARRKFEQTWKDYQAFDNYNSEKGSAIASFSSAKTDPEIQRLNELKQHVQALLEFTM